MLYREWMKKEDMYDLFPRDCSMPSNAGEILRFKRYTQLPKQNFPIDMLKAEYGCNSNLDVRMVNIARITNDSWSINLRTVLGQNIFQKFITKVKNMFFKKRKAMQQQINFLTERLNSFCTNVCEMQGYIDDLITQVGQHERNIKDHANTIEGLRILSKLSHEYVTRNIDNDFFYTSDNLKASGYEYINNYGDRKEIWVKRKNVSKKPEKTKAKKKK